MENGPCQFPAREIEAEHPGRGAGYRRAARHRRGVTAWVEREGAIAVGDAARLFVPPIRLYPPLAAGQRGSRSVALRPPSSGLSPSSRLPPWLRATSSAMERPRPTLAPAGSERAAPRRAG